jgi:hypothetical protein
MAQVTAFSKNSAPRISMKIFNYPFKALFDTGAARSLLHINVFNKIVSDQINCSESGAMSPQQLICSESDVDLFDINNKPLLTKGVITLPIVYGNHVLNQEFIVTNGISELCVIGQDAAINHEFVFDGRSKTIFLARDKSEDHLIVNQGACVSVEKEISETLMTSVGNVRIAPLTSQVVEAEIQGQSDVIAPLSIFLFSPNAQLPEGICIQSFVNNVSIDGKYLIELENKNNQSILLPRKFILGTIEFSCLMVGKVSTSWQSADAEQENDIKIK